MISIKLDVATHDLHYFDKFLSEGIVGPLVKSLRASGSYDRSLRLYQRTYEVGSTDTSEVDIFKRWSSADSPTIKKGLVGVFGIMVYKVSTL